MKHFKLVVFGLLLSNFSFGQIIKIQMGTSFSSLDWKIDDLNIAPYKKTLTGYSVFAGVEYFNRKYFNISTNLGFIRKGGKDVISYSNEEGEYVNMKEQEATLDYLSINTALDIKYPIREKIVPFVGIGPRIDYLLSNNREVEGINGINPIQEYSFGLIVGGGIKYLLSRIQLGVRADYYLNFNKMADRSTQVENLAGEINDKTMTLNLSIGYRL